jgi:uncharacterized membrane protein YcaP (DUF421 family)
VDIIVRAAVIYVFVWLVLRALGKRELGELSAFELVLLFIIGDLVQQSITQDDKSLTAAVLAISVISLLIVVQSYAAFKWRRTRSVLEGTPVMLVYNGQVIEGPLHRERMTMEDLEEAAREHGIEHLREVRAAVLESGGKLSFITSQGSQSSPDDRHAACGRAGGRDGATSVSATAASDSSPSSAGLAQRREGLDGHDGLRPWHGRVGGHGDSGPVLTVVAEEGRLDLAGPHVAHDGDGIARVALEAQPVPVVDAELRVVLARHERLHGGLRCR